MYGWLLKFNYPIKYLLCVSFATSINIYLSTFDLMHNILL